MPSALTYPGVYVEEMPSAVRTITGVPTSITAFVGRAWKGPLDEPVLVSGYADFERTFGGLWRESTMSYAVQQYFANGGGQAYIVRVATRTGGSQAKPATITLTGGAVFRAANPGSWGMNLSVTTDLDTKDTADAKLFNLTVLDDPLKFDDSAKRGGSGASETFRNVSVDATSPRFVTKIVAEQSQLVRVDSGLGSSAPTAQTKAADATSGTDGNAVGTTEVVGGTNLANLTGMYALTKADIFNLLCIPPYTPTTADNGVGTTWTDAANFCKERRAVLIVDSPSDWTLDSAAANYPPKKIGPYHGIADDRAALYFPWVRVPDPLQDNNLADFAPCGVVAGVIARTDTERGVWKAPAGIEAGLSGVLDFSINGLPGSMTEDQNGVLNPLGINCLRMLPGLGPVVWGARTLEGADNLASQWKYLPVRRTALYIEESLYRGTQWVVFEPNDEPLWAQIRLNIGAFMHGLFRQGAFQGVTPRDAYLVKCDRETTTQDDINRGVVNILVGFAPLKPAEFVVIKIQQLAGQVQA